MKTLIVGMGEIGRGLYEATESFHIIDTYDTKDGGTLPKIKDNIDVMNICINGNLPNFVDIVEEYVYRVLPKCVIIHSTVPIGTTRKIMERTDISCVHSPVRGVHPNMKESIQTYIKYVGYNDLAGRDLAVRYYHEANIPFKVLYKSETTELAKMLSTTRYGLNLMFARLTLKLCENLNLNAREVYQEWEISYNGGLEQLGMDKYKRPILSFPGEKIGGHCVVENAFMLLEQLYPNFKEDAVLANVLSAIVQIGKGDRELEGF